VKYGGALNFVHADGLSIKVTPSPIIGRALTF